jgi:hypothetical protein
MGKSNCSHEVLLAPLAVTVLESCPRQSGGDFVFGFNGRSPPQGEAYWKQRIDELSGVTDWVWHDSRRTMTRFLQGVGVAPHIWNALLGHVPPLLDRTYGTNPLTEARREAWARWAAHVETITTTNPAASAAPAKEAP